MSAGLDNLKHIVVLMMSGRSFDHMLGGLSLVMENGKKKYPRINGLTGTESNPDTQGAIVKVQPNARFQGQLDPMPDHHFPGVDLQIFGGAPPEAGRVANMQGFVRDYFSQTNDVNRSHNIMYYFAPDKLPVLTTLATQFAVFNGWFSSIPGPTLCNRVFAHYGTSFGQIGMDFSYIRDSNIVSVYERLIQQGRTAKLYYYDSSSPIFAPAQLAQSRLEIAATYSQFVTDCATNQLPDYSFIDPCHNSHTGPAGGQILASDQHPDHNVQEGERFIANTYNAIRTNPDVWKSTAFLIVYDSHCGIYDHVVPPACTPDGYTANETGTGQPFAFDRLGVRVPAVLISPWIGRGTIVQGTETPNAQVFEHASIPSTVAKFFLAGSAELTIRAQKANTFLGILTDQLRPDSDVPFFKLSGGQLSVDLLGSNRPASKTLLAQVVQLREAEQNLTPSEQSGIDTHSIKTEGQAADYIRAVTAKLQARSQSPRSTRIIAGFHSDVAAGEDLLDITSEVESLCSVIAAKDVEPPISIGLFGDWGSGKTFFMQKMEEELNFIGRNAQLTKDATAYCSNIVQLWFNAWHYADANLWASLASHIFEGLAEYVSPSGDDEHARALLLSKLQTAKELRAEAERERARALEQRRQTESALTQLAERRAKTEARLAGLRLPDLQELLKTDSDLRKELEQTLKSLGFPAAMKNLAILETTLEEAHSLSGRLRAAAVSVWQTKNPTTQIFLLVLVLVGFPVLTWVLRVWLPNRWLFTATGTAWGELSVIAVSMTATLRKYLALGSTYLSKLESARNKIADLLETKKHEKSREELALEKELHEIKAKEAGTSKQFSDAQAEVTEIEAKIREIDEGRNLSKFLLERVRADDYRKHLGIVSSIRKDFETLNELWGRGATVSAGSLPQIDRIVLYIDDLDRCRERTVVEVLEAIHLLLFFPLFVVIVGADSRWLIHSLKQQSRALQDTDRIPADSPARGRSDWQFGPLSYLEKIFQIPYSLQPMQESGFHQLMNNLTRTPEPTTATPNSEPPPRQPDRETQQDAPEIPTEHHSAPAPSQEPSPRPAPPARIEQTVAVRPFIPNPRRLRLEECERRLIQELYPLIPSPRAAKRAANIYRLLRCSTPEEDLERFVRPDKTGEYQAVQLLIAIQVGHPEQAERIIRDLVIEPLGSIQGKWWDFVAQVGQLHDPAKSRHKTKGEELESESWQWRAFFARLTPLRDKIATNESCDNFIKWAPRVARFSFRSATPIPSVYEHLIKLRPSR